MATRVLINSVRLLAAIGGVAMISTGECEMLFIGVFVSFFLMGTKIENFPSLSNFMGVVQPYLAAIMLGVGIIDFMYLSNSFLLSVAHFLLGLQGLRLLALRTSRECMGSVLLSSMMMLSASTLAVDWTYFLFLVSFLGTVIWTLILYTVQEESRFVSAQYGRPPLEENTLLWRKVVPVIRWSSLVAFLVAVLCCAGVFAVFPRFNFQGFRGQFLQPVRKTGFTTEVDMAKSGRVFGDDSVVMRVAIKPKDRDKWTGYLRGQALETYDGRSWKNSQNAPTRTYGGWRTGVPIPVSDERPGELLRQDIYLESMDSPILFAAPRPIHFTLSRPFLEVFPDGGVQRVNNDTWRIHYEVDSFASQLDPMVNRRKLKAAKGFSSVRQAISLPDNIDELTALASKLSVGARSDLEKADRISAYLRNNYKYSLQLPPLKKGEDPVSRFLFESKQGHCEYFAAAMCLMLRSQGISARMATGFLSREWNGRGNYYIVRMKDAHAWVEANIEPYGWMGFDPSPRDVAVGNADPDWMQRASDFMDYMNLRWNRYILSYDLEKQVTIIKNVTQESNKISLRLGHFSTSFERFMGSLKGRQSKLTLPRIELALGIAFVLFVFVVKSFFGKRDRVWFYSRLVRIIEKKSGKKISNHTLKEFIGENRAKFGPTTAELDFLEAEYHRLRFGPAAQAASHDASRVREALRKL